MNRKYLMITYIFTFIYLLSNLYNIDNSIILDSTSLWDTISIKRESSNFYGLFDSYFTIILKILFPILLFIGGCIYILNGDNPTSITFIMIVISILFYIYSTYRFNTQDFTNICYTTQLQLTDSKESDIILDSKMGYRLIYSLGLFGLIFISLITQSSAVVIGILLYFIIGILFQVFGSYILTIFTEDTSWPSIFNYLDQFIQNTNTKQSEDDHLFSSNTIYKIIGTMRLLILVVLSGMIGYFLVNRKSGLDLQSISVEKIIQFTVSCWVIFILLIMVWQTIIGDGCIINRTINEHNKENVKEDTIAEQIYESIQCSISNQLGIYFYLIIIPFIFFYVGVTAN